MNKIIILITIFISSFTAHAEQDTKYDNIEFRVVGIFSYNQELKILLQIENKGKDAQEIHFFDIYNITQNYDVVTIAGGRKLSNFSLSLMEKTQEMSSFKLKAGDKICIASYTPPCELFALSDFHEKIKFTGMHCNSSAVFDISRKNGSEVIVNEVNVP